MLEIDSKITKIKLCVQSHFRVIHNNICQICNRKWVIAAFNHFVSILNNDIHMATLRKETQEDQLAHTQEIQKLFCAYDYKPFHCIVTVIYDLI